MKIIFGLILFFIISFTVYYWKNTDTKVLISEFGDQYQVDETGVAYRCNDEELEKGIKFGWMGELERLDKYCPESAKRVRAAQEALR